MAQESQNVSVSQGNTGPGGHRPEHARTEALWGLRVRVHEDAGGIDILPAPGSPAAKGRTGSDQETPGSAGDDPVLGKEVLTFTHTEGVELSTTMTPRQRLEYWST